MESPERLRITPEMMTAMAESRDAEARAFAEQIADRFALLPAKGAALHYLAREVPAVAAHIAREMGASTTST